MKVLVVGMNPGSPGKNPNKSKTLERLYTWMDEVGVQTFSFCNTFDEVGTPAMSKVDFKRLCTLTAQYDKILALGGFVSTALDKIDVDHFKLPHPSPLNRLLNDKQYEREILCKCASYLR